MSCVVLCIILRVRKLLRMQTHTWCLQNQTDPLAHRIFPLIGQSHNNHEPSSSTSEVTTKQRQNIKGPINIKPTVLTKIRKKAFNVAAKRPPVTSLQRRMETLAVRLWFARFNRRCCIILSWNAQQLMDEHTFRCGDTERKIA